MKLITFIAILLISFVGISQTSETNLKTGDIVFQDFNFELSTAIKIITKSEFSHIGVIIINNGQIYVYEAVQPVRITKFKDWISRNKDNKYVVKRIKNYDKIFTQKGIEDFKAEIKKHINKNYDGLYAWSDKNMYCSELIWKVYKNAFNIEVGKLEKLGDYDFSNKIVKEKLKQIYGGKIPVNETVVSPQAIYESDKLIIVN